MREEKQGSMGGGIMVWCSAWFAAAAAEAGPALALCRSSDGGRGPEHALFDPRQAERGSGEKPETVRAPFFLFRESAVRVYCVESSI
jgi:hypothetical protein